MDNFYCRKLDDGKPADKTLNLVATCSLESVLHEMNQIFRINIVLKVYCRYIETLKAYYRSEINAHYHSFVSYYINGNANIAYLFLVCISRVIIYKGSCY